MPGGDGPGGDDLDLDPDPDPEDVDQILEEIERKRSLRGWAAVAVATVGILFSTYQMWLAARGFVFEFTLPVVGTYRIAALQSLQVRAIHVTFALILAYLMYPPTSGDGRVARNLGRIPPMVRDRFGESPVTAGVDRLRDGVRWFVVDTNRDRVTPADITLIFLAFLPTIYYFRHFDEITAVIRVRGLGGGATIGELYPSLAPLEVGLFAEYAVAYLMGVLAILLVLEATRRSLGLLLMGLVSLFILYGRYGHMIPRDWPGFGILSISYLRWDQIVQNLWYTGEGILGVPVAVSVRFIYIFILFGAFLEMSGAGKWFIDLAYSLTGTRKGGPAKASVVSSGFMGMLSGSSVANTVTTGALTIPLMKRSGYSAEFAGAVESSVSSGGQILPPVMGAAAFLIVEFTGTPFREVIIAATLPALMFFFGMWVMVHFEAAKHGIGGLPRSELLDVGPHMRRGWFYLVPIGLLLYYIVIARLSIGRAGWLTILAVVALIAMVAAYNEQFRPYLAGGVVGAFTLVAVSLYLTGTHPVGVLMGRAGEGLPVLQSVRGAFDYWEVVLIAVGLLALLARPAGAAPLLELDDTVNKAAGFLDERYDQELATTRAGLFVTFFFKSMDNGARTATVVVIAVAAAGIIPGIIGLTGLAGSLRRFILTVSAGSLVLLLILAGISAIIVGMGMPTTVMYIVIIVLLGPTLGEFGIAILATHLFVLYLGLMADVTPPVGVAAFAAAGVAKSEPIQTCITAFLLSLNKILVPFAFVFAPGILLLRGADQPGEVSVVGWADVTDLGFFLPEVLVPVVAVFVGVYGLGVAIIGYYKTYVSRPARWGFIVSAGFLSIPAMVLMPAGTALGFAGVDVTLYTMTTDLALRGVGAVMFAALIFHNTRKARAQPAEEERPVDRDEPVVAGSE